MSSTEASKVIMVHSYKGGTGKTAIAVNLAQYLIFEGKKRVLLIEQDIGGPTFSKIFNINPKLTWNDFYSPDFSLKDLIIQSNEYDLICAKAGNIEIPTGQDQRVFYSRQFERLRLQKKWLVKNYDYIILDTQPGYSIELLNSILMSDVAILVTRLDTDAIEKTIDMYNDVYADFKEKKIILIQNQIPEPIDNYKPTLDPDIEKSMNEWEDFIREQLFVTIPLKNEIAYMLSLSKFVPLNSLFMDYIRKIARFLI